MNALGMSMTETSLFSLASMIPVIRTDYVQSVGELAYYLVMYVRCLLPPATVCPLIFPSCFFFSNICDSNTIWPSSYVRSCLYMGIKVFLRCSCFISLLDAECTLSPHYFTPALRDNWVMITYACQDKALHGSLVVSWHINTFFLSW